MKNPDVTNVVPACLDAIAATVPRAAIGIPTATCAVANGRSVPIVYDDNVEIDGALLINGIKEPLINPRALIFKEKKSLNFYR